MRSLIRTTLHSTFALITLGLLAALPAAGSQEEPSPPDARIGGGENLGNHHAVAEELQDQEGRSENIQNHEGRFEDIHPHAAPFEKLRRHHAESESLDGRSRGSERLFGMKNDPELALSAAREKLLNARQRHARAVARVEKTVSTRAGQNPNDRDTWPHRLEVGKQRIVVAEANLQVFEKAYADMLRDDYPRGQARQDLIAGRQRAMQRLEAERAKLPKLVERARDTGVRPSVLLGYRAQD
jgi:hypothetical protein